MKIDKKKIVIDNYFKTECNTDTTIREAYRKGFERALQKTKHTWIPCSERLPEYYKTVLVTLNDNSVYIMSRIVLFLSNDDVWEDENGDFVQMDEVKAWMPLPEPYRRA